MEEKEYYQRYVLGEFTVTDEQKIRELCKAYSKEELAGQLLKLMDDIYELQSQLDRELEIKGKTKEALTKLIEKINYDWCICLKEHHIDEYVNYFYEELESSDKV